MTKVNLTSEPEAPRQYNGERPYLTEGNTLSDLKPIKVTTELGDDFGEQLDLGSLLDGTPEADAKLRDLAIRISVRGVAFFRNQQNLTYDQQKDLVVKMAHLTGSPKESGLHVHPGSKADGGKKIEFKAKEVEAAGKYIFPNLFSNQYWHVDSTFEVVGPAYSCLKLERVPENGGGDTLWCSLFDCCDKLSPSFLRYLETLTATHDSGWLKAFGTLSNMVENRGHPDNSTQDLVAVHPVIATHPVTGWKVLYVNRSYTKHINGVTQEESTHLLEYLYRIISDNHDVQARYRWDPNGVAIWDNRSTAHCATNDYSGKDRYGVRTMSIGERLETNPKGQTKGEALRAQQSVA